MRTNFPRWGLIAAALVIFMCAAVGTWAFLSVNSSLNAPPTRTPFQIPTRTRRPTYTPTPSPTLLPTLEPSATSMPLRRPTRTPTRRPTRTPTPSPVPLPSVPLYRYQSANRGCVHSGQTFIQGTIYRAQYHVTEVSRVNGVIVAMSWMADGPIVDRRTSGQDGFWSMIVDAFGPAPGQKRFVWVLENDRRASDIVEFDFNNYNENNSASCWRGFVDFVQLY